MRLRLITAAVAAGVALALAAPASAQPAEPADRRAELAREYVALMDLEGMMREQFAGMIDMVGELDAGLGPKGSEPSAPIERFESGAELEAMDQMFALFLPMLTEVMVAAHAQVFSEAELEALVGFYGAPIGQNILGKQVDLNLAMMSEMIRRTPDWLSGLEAEWEGLAPGPVLSETANLKLYGA